MNVLIEGTRRNLEFRFPQKKRVIKPGLIFFKGNERSENERVVETINDASKTSGGLRSSIVCFAKVLRTKSKLNYSIIQLPE